MMGTLSGGTGDFGEKTPDSGKLSAATRPIKQDITQAQDADARVQSDAKIKEIDTAAINSAPAKVDPKPSERKRHRQGKAVAGQISRLKLALLFFIPLLFVSLWTETAPFLEQWGFRHSLADLPGDHASVNVRGLLQLLLVIPILYAGRQFFGQALSDLKERIPSPEMLLLCSTVFSVAGGIYTAIQLLLGGTYRVLPPLFLGYTGAAVTLALVSAYLDRWSKAPLPEFRDLPAMWLLSGGILLTIVVCLSFFYTGRGTAPLWQPAFMIFICCCPVGLMPATSLAAFAAVSKAASMQVLLRDGTILGHAYKTTLAVFDKTGTLTIGRPLLTDIHIFHNGSEAGLLSLAAAMLQKSDLPEAEAVRTAAEGCKLPVCTEIKSMPEGWYTARCCNENIRLGTLEFVRRFAAIPTETESYVEQLSDAGKTVWYLAVGRTLYAIFGFSDTLRKEAPEAMRMLKELGVETAVMTGDNKRAGLYLGKLSGADRVAAELLPTHKAQLVDAFRRGGHTVAVIGDGDNDAPAIAQADVGFAAGSGTKAVWKAAQAVLTDNDLRNVARTLILSRGCAETVKRNLRVACLCNLVLLPFATGITALFGGPVLRPWMTAVATLVCLAAQLLNTWNFKQREK